MKTAIGCWLYETAAAMQRNIVSCFRENGYTTTYEQWVILINLAQIEGITQSELACKLNRDNSSVTRIIDTMERHKLVERKEHETDRRANCIHLTEKGKKLQEELFVLSNRVTQEALKNVTDQEAAQVIQTLEKIKNQLFLK